MPQNKYIIGYDMWDIIRGLKYEEREARRAGDFALFREQQRERKRLAALPPPPVQLRLPFEDGPGEKDTGGRAS